MNTNTKNTGKVKFFNEASGYGFIIDEATGKDIFVHAKGCKEKIKKDESVNYDVVEGRKGLEATNVTLA